MNGVIVINKPEKYTSFDVVAVVRRLLHTKKVGHCGTLDPNATGVLPVLVGNATKAQDIIPNHDKEYKAQFKFGVLTDTLDVWGEVIRRENSAVTKRQLESALEKFTGEIMQTPPMYSAVQKDGVRLYELARKGIEVEREARKITVYSLTLLSFDEKLQTGEIIISCSKGTYIRSLISDIAEFLGTVGIMTALTRTKACGFPLNDAITLDELELIAESENFEKRLLCVEDLFRTYRKFRVSQKQAVRFYNGNELSIERTALRDMSYHDGEIFRVKDEKGDFLGLGIVNCDKDALRIYKHFEK